MHGVVSLETNQSHTDCGEVDQNIYDAPSSTDNSDNEGVNHEANGDSDNADNESSNNDNENNLPLLNAARNPDYNVVNNEDHDDDTNNAQHDSDNEEEEAQSDSQRLEYDWNYAEQDSISDSDEYDWNFGYEEDQDGTNNATQNITITTQTVNVEEIDSHNSKQDGPSSSENKDSASGNQDSQNAEKNDSNSGKPNETSNPDDQTCQGLQQDELTKTQNDNLKLFHSLELDESKNAKPDDVNSVGLGAVRKTQNDETKTDENKTSDDGAKGTGELKSDNTGLDCGRGAIRRTIQSSTRDRDIFNSTSRTNIRKSNQNAYKKSPFGNSDEMFSVRDFSVDQDFNYADYINICASSYAASNSAESDNFSGYRSPNLSRYGNLNSPGFGDSGEHSYETEHSAVHEAPVNPEHGTIQTPTYSTSGTGYSGGGDPTSLSLSSPVSPSHGIQDTSSGFNTPGYDVSGWSDHRAPYSSTYEGPHSFSYAAPEISNYNTDLPEYSSSRSSGYTALGSSGFIAPGSSTYDVSVSSRYGVPGLTGYVPSRSPNYEISASAHYGGPGYSTYGPSPTPSWTSGSSGSEYGTFAPSSYSAPISASYGAPELFDYRTSNPYGYSTQGTPVYDASAYYGYSADARPFGYCNVGSSGYSASMSPGYDVSGSAVYCPSGTSTYSTTHSSCCSNSLTPDYGTPHATHRVGSTIPSSSVPGNLGSSDYGISNLSVCVPVSSHYGPTAFSGFGASSSTGLLRTSRYGPPSMAGSSPSGFGLGPQTKINEGIKSADNKSDSTPVSSRGQRHVAANLGTGSSTRTGHRGIGPIAEASAYDQGAGPMPGPGYGRGRASRRGRSPIFGPIVPWEEIENNRGRAQMSQYGPVFGQRPIIESVRGPGLELGAEPELIGRGRGRGRGRRDANGN